MQYREYTRISVWEGFDRECVGVIKLKHIADPETVKVYLLGERIYPKKFSNLGYPMFSKEVCYKFDWKEKELKRRNGEDYILFAEVVYSEAVVDIDPLSINSIAGIKSNISDLKSLKQLIKDRELYHEIHGDDSLDGFVLFGRYYLNKSGMVLELAEKCELSEVPDVCTWEEFDAMQEERGVSLCFMHWDLYANIPSEGDSCPWCTRKITIDDAKKERFGTINDKIAHMKCVREFEHEREINDIIYRLVKTVYGKDFTFDLIPNGHCDQLYCAHIPWFLCHTPDGDIEIGRRKKVISIEWKENFKTFDMSIFDSENVTKGENGKSRYIHASSTGSAFEYLSKAKRAVNK